MIISKKIGQRNLFVFLIGLLFFGGFYPALWNSIIFKDQAITISIIFLFLWGLIFFKINYRKNIRKINSVFLSFIVVLFIYFIFRFFIFDDNVAYTLLVLILACTAILFAYSTIDIKYFMNKLVQFQILIIFFTIAGIILLYTGFLGSPNQLVLSGYEDKVFLNYKLFIVKHNVVDDFVPLFVRSSGFYDEPGSFAFVNLLLLTYNKLHLGNKKYELILLIGGLITLSAAHIITVLLYLIFFYVNKNNFGLFLLILLAFISVYFLPIDQEWFTFFKSRTYDRIVNIFEGTDKSRDYDVSYEAFKYFYLTGENSIEILKKFPSVVADTFWFTLAKNGIIGSIIYYSLFIYILIKSIRVNILSDQTKLIILLMVNFIQRPEYISPIYIYIIYFTWFYNHNNSLLKRKKVNLHNNNKL